MPESALEATEQQFLELLGAAAGDSWVHLRFFSLPGVPRSERGRSYLSQSYCDVTDIRQAELDGLIVTGTEPKAARLSDEPYWPAFTQLVDWAARNTISTVWSCLAAHAAVLHLDGIERVLLPEKRIGVFDCDKLARASPYFGPAGARGGAARALERAARGCARGQRLPGAHALAHGRCRHLRAAGAEQSLFLFFQGHPEYGAGALLSEFRRDVGRFLKGEREHYPAMPQHYFDAATEAALAAFRGRAWAQRGEELLAEFPVPADPALSANWQPFAVTVYRNWLSAISAQKQRQQGPAEYLAALRLDRSPAPAV